MITSELRALADKHGTDKSSHGYCEFYESLFGPRRHQPIRILELGVGGFERPDDPHFGGASLRMWKEYFPEAQIVAIDINDKSRLSEPRIQVEVADQTDRVTLERLCSLHGPFDFVIDDASHILSLTVKSFEILFPLLAPNGIYAIEDLSTSYWPKWGGSFRRGAKNTTMALVKRRMDGLNFAEFKLPRFQPSASDLTITEIRCRHNIVAFFKGENSIPSDRNQPHPIGLDEWVRDELLSTLTRKAMNPSVIRMLELTGTRRLAGKLRRRVAPNIER